MIEKLLQQFFKAEIKPFEYQNLPLQFLVKEDKFQFTEDYVTPEVTIPKGFITDGASTPRLLKGLYPGYYKYFPAAAVHDFLYGQGIVPRKVCDELFRNAMRYRLKLSYRYWLFMWLSVRMGGRSHYTKRVMEGNVINTVK